MQLGRNGRRRRSRRLTRALAHAQGEPDDGIELAEVRFALAQALAPSEGPRAVTLANEALAALAKAGERQHKEAGEITKWIARQRR